MLMSEDKIRILYLSDHMGVTVKFSVIIPNFLSQTFINNVHLNSNLKSTDIERTDHTSYNYYQL